MGEKKQATAGQLLIPTAHAARKLGMSRWTLNRRIQEKEIKAVKVGPRRFIPQTEIDRILGIPPKPVEADQLSEQGADGSRMLQGGDPRGEESLEDLLASMYEEAENLTPEEVEILNIYELEEVGKARARMAACLCIQFSNVPVPRVWRTTDSLRPHGRDLLLSRGLLKAE